MSKISSPLVTALLLSVAMPAASLAQAPAGSAATPAGPTVGPTTTANEWTTWGYDEERTAWNRGETTLSKDNVSRLNLLWNTKVSTPANPVVLSTLTAPVVVSGVKTAEGAKNLLFVLGADDTLFAIDADRGGVVWQKNFPNRFQAKKEATWLCSNTANATPVIDKARGLIFFAASDGMLRAHNLADGAERMQPVELTTPFARSWSFNLIDGVLYTPSGRACGEIQDPNSDWAAASITLQRRAGSTAPVVQTDPSAVTAIDVRDLNNPRATRFFTSGARPSGAWGRGGVVRAPNNNVVFMTSDGLFDPGSGNWGDTVLKLSPKAVRVTDSFTPENHQYIMSKDLAGSGSPTIFPFAGKSIIAAAQKEGVLYLLDADDMGGGKAGKHEKYLFKSPQLGNDAAAGTDPGMGVWGAITTYLTPSGKRFIYIPMHGPPSKSAPEFPVKAGETPNGSIMAFEIVQRGENIVAEPRWMSNDLIMPDPPAVANGVVFATSTGGQWTQNPRRPDGTRVPNTDPISIKNRSTPVGNLTLYAYDAETGKQLFSSGKSVPGWVHFSQPVVALGKVYVVTHDAQVYAFGLDAQPARRR